MSDRAALEVNGLPELLAALREKHGAASRAMEKGLLEKMAAPIVEEARRAVRKRTGALEKGIRATKPEVRKDSAKIRVVSTISLARRCRSRMKRRLKASCSPCFPTRLRT